MIAACAVPRCTIAKARWLVQECCTDEQYKSHAMDSPFQSGALDIFLDDLLCIRAPGTYLMRVAGDSMTRAGIFDGDLLIVDKGAEVKQGQVIIGVVNQEPMVKRLDYVRGMPVLRSEGDGHHHRFIMEGDEFTVWGVVTHSVRQHGIEP
jgi:DNA polymerase V